MKPASLPEIKKELSILDPETLVGLCMRLAKYKKENKELLSYLLFEAHHEPAYIDAVKEEVDDLFTTLPERNVYFMKKTLRKILRVVNKQIKYSGIKETELDLRLYFCKKVRIARVPLTTGTVIFNIYQQQVKKITAALEKLPEDLQTDYAQAVAAL
jgi:hypothetical protein